MKLQNLRFSTSSLVNTYSQMYVSMQACIQVLVHDAIFNFIFTLHPSLDI